MPFSGRGQSLYLLIILAALLTLGSGTAQDDLLASVAKGREWAKTCKACHGVNGFSTTAKWPSLAGQTPEYIQKQLLDFREGRRLDALMAPMAGALTDQKIMDLAAYFSSLPLVFNPITQGTMTQGESIFLFGIADRGVPACSSCHGKHGEGNSILKSPALAGQRADYLKKQVLAFRNGRRTNDSNQIMRTAVKFLKYGEIDLVVEYLELLGGPP